jgi:lysophospholipase L1-like esterase
MDSLNTILNSGTYGENVSRHNDNNSKIKQAITTLENVAIANKGYFDTLASLQAAFPSPKAGNIAYVANVASSTGYYIYNVVSGVWTATTTEAPAVDVAISNYAQHGYSSSPKTLKQVDDEVVQLAGEKTDIEVGYSPYRYSNLQFYLGGINSSTGAQVTNSIRIRTTFPRSLAVGERIEFKNSSPFISQYGLFKYLGSTFVGVTGSGIESIVCDGSFDTIKYQLKKSDDGVFTESDIQTARILVSVNTFSENDTYLKNINTIQDRMGASVRQPLLDHKLPYTVPANKSISSKSLWLTYPFQIMIREKYIGSISIDFDKIGTFSVYKGTDVGTSSFARTLIEQFTITKTGRRRLTFANPLYLQANEWLGIYDASDTSSFVYNNIVGLPGAQNFHYFDSEWKIGEGSLNVIIDEYLDIVSRNVNFCLGGVDADNGMHIENDIRARSERIFINRGDTIKIINNSLLQFQYIIYFDRFKRVRGISALPAVVEYDGFFNNFILTFRNETGTTLSNSDIENLRSNVSIEKISKAYPGEKKITHPYKEKYLSIIGASTNTYDGWIPSGYATYYPHGSMNNPNQQYWWKLLDYFGMNLLTVNAWSGSRVSSGGSGSISDLGRAKLLHRGDKKPDVIIINAGLNDFNHNVPLGNYDGTGTIPTTTATFSDAYGKMIYDMVTEYPLAEIWCCTLQLGARLQEHGYPEKRIIDGVYKSEFNDTIRSIAKHFGVGLIEIDKCGINPVNISSYVCDADEVFTGSGLHPNNTGFNLFFETIRKAWGG